MNELMEEKTVSWKCGCESPLTDNFPSSILFCPFFGVSVHPLRYGFASSLKTLNLCSFSVSVSCFVLFFVFFVALGGFACFLCASASTSFLFFRKEL